MKRLIQLSALSCAVMALVLSCARETVSGENEPVREQEETEAGTMPGVALIYLSESLCEELGASVELDGLSVKSTAFSSAVKDLGIVSMRRLFPYAGEYEPRTRARGLHRWYRVEYGQDVPLTRAGEELSGIEGVEIFEPERRIGIKAVFNDPKLESQWHYVNNGSISSDHLAGSDINVEPVWERYTTGDPSVIVGVVDGGIDYAHEDLAANYAGGYNFLTNGKVTAEDHGTHVAGTIAAVNNNSLGVCGIAGGDKENGKSGVKLLSCQIFSGKQSADGAQAIKWAADNGAVIVNNSWGYEYRTVAEARAAKLGTALKEAIDYFIDYAGCDNDGNQLSGSPMKGGVVFFAAGNEGWDANPIGQYERVVSVGATGPNFTRAYYSNYGAWVDIAAPGGDVNYLNGQVLSTLPDNSYGYLQGTSMACPHVTGVAALLASYFGGPGFTNDMLVERLLKAANEDALPSNSRIGPMMDAFGSFVYGDTVPPENIGTISTSVVGNRIDLTFNVTADAEEVKAYEYVALCSKDKALLEPVSLPDIPEGVVTASALVGPKKVGDPITVSIKGLEFTSPYYVAVAGRDYAGNYSAMSSIIAVSTGENNPPVIELPEISELVIKSHETAEFILGIYDPEGDVLDVSFNKGSAATNYQNLGNGQWKMTVTGLVANPGTYIDRIAVKDKYGLTADASVKYEILPNNAPEILNQADNIFFSKPGGDVVINLDDCFIDPDGESLAYNATVASKTVCRATLEGSTLTVTVFGYGANTVTVTATDARKLSSTFEIKVVVKQEANFLELYPVPVKDILNVRTGLPADTEVVIRDAAGREVHKSLSVVSAFEPLEVDMSGCAPGQYKVSVTVDGKVYEKIISKI